MRARDARTAETRSILTAALLLRDDGYADSACRFEAMDRPRDSLEFHATGLDAGRAGRRSLSAR
jgi:hypothetical protein